MCLPACCLRMLEVLGCPAPIPQNRSVVAPVRSGTAPDAPQQLAWHRIVDLTHTLDPDFPTYGGEPGFEARTLATLASHGWNYREWRVHEHAGTHLDAPFHRSNGLTADRLAPADLVGPIVVIDLRSRASQSPDTQLTPDDLLTWEASHGPLPHGAIVAMNSGWAAYARSVRFRGQEPSGRLHFPGVHGEAAEFLLRERVVKGLIVDTLSLDHGASTEFPTHTSWLGNGRWGLECASNLDDLPSHGATVVVAAPKVAGASGGPCRVLAFV